MLVLPRSGHSRSMRLLVSHSARGFSSSAYNTRALWSSRLPVTAAASGVFAAASALAWSTLTASSPALTEAQHKDASLPNAEAQLAFRNKWQDTVRKMQADMCNMLEKVDGSGKFREDIWTRKEGGGLFIFTLL